MPHPDEGLIHAWLDGELDAAEAARVSALVESDAEWAAAAAEARGLIAASARIVGALDRAPANVIPKAPPARRPSRRWAWQAAAVLALMAGSAVVLEREKPELPVPKANVVAAPPESVTMPAPPPPVRITKVAPTKARDALRQQFADAKPNVPALDKDVAPTAGARAAESSTAPSERRSANAPMATLAQPSAKAAQAPAPAPAQLDPQRLTRLPTSCFEQLEPRDSSAPMIRLSAAALADSIRLETLVLRGGGDTLAAVHGPFTAVRVRCPEP
ncbi:MAG TPA: hypothetical protein VGI97_12285 [Gemmatimonadaceae bacterium]|jgi:hypothetical protein